MVEGPEGPGAVEAVGVGSEGVKGKVVVEGSIAVVEGGEGPEESIKKSTVGQPYDRYDRYDSVKV